MREQYLKMLQESLLLFFRLRPNLSLVETSWLTEYAKTLNENNDFIKKQRYLYNRKDKTFKLSYVLNQFLDEDMTNDFLSLYNSSKLVFKTNINPQYHALLTYKSQPAFQLIRDKHKLKLHSSHRFNQLIELDHHFNVKSRSLAQYIQPDFNNDLSHYVKIGDTKYSLIETMDEDSFKKLINHYRSLYHDLEAVIYELFSIIQYSDCYRCDFELVNGLSKLIELLSYDYNNIENENVLEEIKKQLLMKLPFEVHQALIEDECYVEYLNEYMREFIVRKKDSLYMSQVNFSLDELEESDKGELYHQNKYMLALSKENTENQEFIFDIEKYDLSMSVLQLEKNVIQYLRNNTQYIDSFIYELVHYAYQSSLTSKNVLNKHGSAYNWAVYIIRIIAQLYTDIQSNEEDFVSGIKGKELECLSLYLELFNLGAYKKNQLLNLLNKMISSIDLSKDMKKTDCISKARNYKDNYKETLLNILLYAQKEYVHQEKMMDFKNKDTYIDVTNICYTHIPYNDFINKYIHSFLSVSKNECIDKAEVYAYYLKNIDKYNDFYSFIKDYSKDTKDGLVDECMSEEELINIERQIIENNILEKCEYMVIHEMGTL